MRKLTEFRPWGKFEQFTHNEVSTVKILTIEPGERLSLQYHNNRDEFWRVVEGSALITLDSKRTHAKEGDEFFIRRKSVHSAEGLGDGVRLLEVSFGNFDEDDNIRLDDKYGRQSPKAKR